MKTIASYNFNKKPPKRFRKASTRLKKLIAECPRCNGTQTIVPIAVRRGKANVADINIRCRWCVTLKEILIEVKKLEAMKCQLKLGMIP
jgi:hypothetical protein